jgi:hypothetical protein
MAKRTCFELTDNDVAPIRLIQVGKDNFTVQYGKQVKQKLSYSKAALELGSAIMHALACDGKLDNREKNER